MYVQDYPLVKQIIAILIVHCVPNCTHGTCVGPNKCQCHEDWQGRSCSICKSSNTINSILLQQTLNSVETEDTVFIAIHYQAMKVKYVSAIVM